MGVKQERCDEMSKGIHLPRWIAYVGVFMIFITMMTTSYQLKKNVNKANITNENYLATLVKEDPLYNASVYHEVVVDRSMSETELIDCGKKIYQYAKRPQVIRLIQPVSKESFDPLDQPGEVQEIDFYISAKTQILWYRMIYPLQTIFKENLSDIFDLAIETNVDLKHLVIYAKEDVKAGATPSKFMSYLPTLYEQLVSETKTEKPIKHVKIALETDSGEYIYDRTNQNELIHVKKLTNEGKDGKG